eukprot:TRINITY_DN958_c0_g2_i4.p1 TRINITY_DN958_c0_g2~~TRINITY_DN958_c0_g2_i4.p1  ORF type:complete len:495 (-),score=136.00 TRINITY_DN958_c0_g2_i4:14-1498(-)
MIALLLLAAAASGLRGVPDSQRAAFLAAQKAEVFRCTDGSRAFSFSRVNDDFCDCADGSDEPGTAACPKGRFWCQNLGHAGEFLFSSRVDDGICDCCDGSDESHVACPNTCAELGKAARAKAEAEMKVIREGIEKRKQAAAAGKAIRAKKEDEIKQLLEQVENRKREIAVLKAEKEAREKLEEEERERRRIAFEEEQRLKKAAEAEAAPTGGSNEGAPVEATEVPTEVVLEDDEDLFDEEKERLEDEQRANTQAQATTAPPKYVDEESGEREDERVAETDTEAFSVPDDDLLSEERLAPEDDPEDPEDAEEEDGSTWRILQWLDRAANWLLSLWTPAEPVSEAERLRKEVTSQDATLRDLERKVSDLQAELQVDYGDDDRFLTLAGQCFSAKVRQYTYEVCPFGKAKQQGDSYSDLGQNKAVEDNYTKLKWSNGARCWQGPAREITVTLECSSSTELVDVEEPNKCVYAGKLRTPLACDPKHELALELNLGAEL